MNLTTLGWLKHLNDPYFEYFEYHYLKVIHRFLTDRWWILQSGFDEEALQEWMQVMKVLELDKKATMDLILLAQSGLPGRCKANEVLFQLLSKEALDPTYEDLSHKVSNAVGWARRSFDRPPREHGDLKWWWWTCYDEPYARDLRWSPLQVPRGVWTLQQGPGGRPLAPPGCWGQLPRQHQ